MEIPTCSFSEQTFLRDRMWTWLRKECFGSSRMQFHGTIHPAASRGWGDRVTEPAGAEREKTGSQCTAMQEKCTVSFTHDYYKRKDLASGGEEAGSLQKSKVNKQRVGQEKRTFCLFLKWCQIITILFLRIFPKYAISFANQLLQPRLLNRSIVDTV